MRTQFLRRDFLSARIVDTGIAMQEQCGTRPAADFLKDNFIALNVAMRVLLHPHQRRS